MSTVAPKPVPPTAPQYSQAPPSSGKWVAGCVLGCLGMLLLTVVGVIVGGWYLAQFAKEKAIGFVEEEIRSQIDKSPLNPAEKQSAKEQVARVASEFKAGRITLEQVGKVFEGLSKSPAFASFVVNAAYARYVHPSGLRDAEKAAAKTTIERAARGGLDGRIPKDTLDQSLSTIEQTDAEGKATPKEKLTEEEIRSLLAQLKKLADDAGIEPEPQPVDFAAEFKRIVDTALASPK